MVEPTGVKRKLAVIIAADVEGCSRLMGADEEATLRTLSGYREIIDGLVAEHRGRVFGSAGDSWLAEFASAGRLAPRWLGAQADGESAFGRLPARYPASCRAASTVINRSASRRNADAVKSCGQGPISAHR